MSGLSRPLQTPPRGTSGDMPIPGTVDSDVTVPLPLDYQILDMLKITSDQALVLKRHWEMISLAVTQEQLGMDVTVKTSQKAIDEAMKVGGRQLKKDANRVKLIETSKEVFENYCKFRESVERASAAADLLVANRVEKYARTANALNDLKTRAKKVMDCRSSHSDSDEE
jgi:hypothetical protein